MFITTITIVPPVYIGASRSRQSDDSPTSSPGESQDTIIPIEDQYPILNDYSISDSDPIQSGVLDSVVIEQSGHAASDNISARTDSHENLAYDLPIDTIHSWVADEAEVSVWNLQRQYVVNGSFDEGIAGTNVKPNGSLDAYPLGWSANSTDGGGFDDDLQIASYDDTGRKFVVVESIGGKTGQQGFTHDGGTRIVWTQNVNNTPYSEDFLLSFDYFYVRGPLEINPSYPIPNDFNITVFVDGSAIWTMSLKDLSERGVWTNTGLVSVSIPGAPSTFEFGIGLDIPVDQYLDIRWDYDNNTISDGIGNAAYVTVYLDDVTFLKETPPTPDQVALQFSTGGVSETPTGSLGTYSASISNSSYWIDESVPVTLSANTSVSFNYKTRLFSHRFTDSNWEPNVASTGVSYSIEHGKSPNLLLYSYVGYLGDYEEPEMTVNFPSDWENVTVSDPFLTEQTSSCTINSDFLVIPSSIISFLGWWEVRFESPNYAKSITIEKYYSGSTDWSEDAIYRIGNATRTKVTIGANLETPTVIDGVNVTWLYPDGTQWTNESLDGAILGVVTGGSHTFASGSSPAGEWCVEVLWTNGTEVAFDVALFEVHHSANLVGDPEVLETDAGLEITAIVRYSDSDTSAYITDDLTTISGNWSLSTIFFDANPSKNWWDVPLDTSDIGAGNFIIKVDAARPYYDAVSCEIQIVSTNVTRLNSPNAPWTSANWGSEVSLTFNFEVFDSDSSSWGPVGNTSDVIADVNWTTGFWSVSEDITPGIYLFDIDTSAQPSGTYLLDFTFEKTNHESQQLFLTLIVSPIATSLLILGEPTARVNISDDYVLKMRYSDVNEIPIPSAFVGVDSVSPPTGLSHTSVEEVSGEPGNYTVTLTPNAAGVFAVRFVANETNSEPANTVFVLVVNDLATELAVLGGDSFEIGLTDIFNTSFTFKTIDDDGVENASISILVSGTPGGVSGTFAETGLGEYSVEFSASLSGTYVVTIAGFKQYYQSASDSFFLVVRDITTNFTSLNGSAGIVSFGQDYQLFLQYTNGSGWGLDGADIVIESVVPETGLSWSTTVSEGSGMYSILLTPESSNTFTVLIKASLLNHQVQFLRFTITATAIATSLTILNTSTAIAFDQDYTVYIYYQSENLTGLPGASLSVQNPPAEVSYTAFEDLGVGYYRVTLSPLEIGTYDLIFRAELPGYQSDTSGFVLSATRIQTELRFASGESSATIDYLETREISVIFERTDFNTPITEADISIQISPSTGIEWTYHEADNAYHIEIEPGRVGRWTLTISASKTGYSLGSVQFIVDVEPVSILAELLTSSNAVEGHEFPIEIKLTHESDGSPVSNASVEFRMTAVGDPAGTFESMRETSTPGVYSVLYTFPLYLSTTEYDLEIRVSKDNYELVGESFGATYEKLNDDVLRWTPVITGSGIFVVVLIGSVIGLRIFNTRKKRKNLEALQVKKRFDDVSNILGIIALHKKSGLPVYSKMIKGGFEEAMVSAFITAITHFRSEFEMDEKHWEFNVIPISDIISAVPTKSLIVAFITVRPPSKFQAVGMEAFGRATGAMFDESLAETKSAIVDDEQTKILDTLFYDLLDGYLIERFRTTKDANFPKSMSCLVATAHQLENGEGFKLEDLAKGMASCGVEESYAYKTVMDAIDDELIELAETENPDPISGPFTDSGTPTVDYEESSDE